MDNSKEKEIPLCIIDEEDGKFKYIQIKETSKKDKSYSRILIRGTARFLFHRDIFGDFMENIDSKSDFNYEPLGGGRILRDKDQIKVYGYSTAYGQADHEYTCKVLTKILGNKYNITYSYEGY